MLILTVLHWNRFDFSRLPAQLWLGLYIVTPLLVPWLWWRNRPVDPGILEPGDVVVPVAIRTLTAVIGVLFLCGALLFFIFPGSAVAIWPWQLTLLSGRALGGWFALFGVGAVVVAYDPRWSAWRIEIESMVLWQVLILTAAAFNLGDFNRPLNWYLIATAAGIAGFFLIYAIMEQARRQS